MESRRNTRSTISDAPKTRRAVAGSSPSRRSPASTRRSPGRKSPAQKSPARKSPARRSPVRKSPTRRSPARKSPVGRRSPARRNPPPKSPVHASPPRSNSANLTKRKPGRKPKAEIMVKDIVDHSDDKINFSSKVLISKMVSSQVKIARYSTDKDVNVIEVPLAKRESSQTKFETKISQNLTPTPSERSRLSTSRSMSRSILDENDHSDNSDSEVEALLKHAKTEKSYKKYSPDYSLNAPSRSEYYSRREATTIEPEFGGNLGAFFLILLLSAGAYFVQFICTRQLCGCSEARVQKLKILEFYVNLESAALFFGYTWAVFLLDPLSLGRKISISTNRGLATYKFNGLLTAIIFGIAIVTAEMFNYPIIKIISRSYNRLMSLSILSALLTALWLYPRLNYNRIRINEQNPYAKCSGFLYKYFVGRELEPSWFGAINIKLAHLRLSIITTLVFSAILIYKNLKFTPLPPLDVENSTVFQNALRSTLHIYSTTSYNSLALLIAVLIGLHQIDALIFEHHLRNSFELQHEGLGAFALLRYAIYPHFNCLIAKYVLEHPFTIPTWSHWLIGTLFLCGLYLKRRSSSMKYAWATRSKNANAFDSLGCKFITSWPWGKIRHPNYLGEIICYISLVIPLIWHFDWPPLVPALYTIILLIHRAKRSNARCADRYHSLWKLYCNRTSYNLVPYVY